MEVQNCYHCGGPIVKKEEIVFDELSFCCTGCQTVYEIFSANDLTSYYEMGDAPGARVSVDVNRYNFLDQPHLVEKLISFDEGGTQITNLYIPHIHCSSCIWILENLNKLLPGVQRSQVNFHEKKVRIVFNSETSSLKDIVLLLAKIGYEPYLSLEDYDQVQQKIDRSLIYRIGVAFFCFGNVMLLSFPEYFEVDEFWIQQYKGFFRWLIFGISLPAFLYSGWGYYEAAWKSIKAGILSIEIPIALGIIVMFLRSSYDIIFDHSQGFFDSMCSLIFFMLLGKLFQQKTYNFLSFERDYKSYFPMAVTKLVQGAEQAVAIYDIKIGDRLLIRNQELIPVDGILMSPQASIDYAFVSGEAEPIVKTSGDKIFAGGKQLGSGVEMEVLHEVSQSYLTSLWSHAVFQKEEDLAYRTLTDKISHYFTPGLLALAVLSFIGWFFVDVTTAFNVFTAILIVACPCALALTAPFTLGNVLRYFGSSKLYLKDAQVIEKMAQIDTVVFDKTGTLTTNSKAEIHYEGAVLEVAFKEAVKSVVRNSNHPLNRRLYSFFEQEKTTAVAHFEEVTGKGISGEVNGLHIALGSASFLQLETDQMLSETVVHLAINGVYQGKFVFDNPYRAGMETLLSRLHSHCELVVLSGDNAGEEAFLKRILPEGTTLVFNQKPDQKLNYIKNLQQEGKYVMMVGDGLNDAGALAQSNVGISISENVNVFSPACDGILDAQQFQLLDTYLKLSKKAVKTIKWSFGLSLLYNAVGLTFAVCGLLSPLVAAIIMPLSTITIVSFVSLQTAIAAKRAKI